MDEVAFQTLIEAFNCLLRDHEGIVIDTEETGRVIVHKKDKQIFIVPYEENREEDQHGKLVWVHEDKPTNADMEHMNIVAARNSIRALSQVDREKALEGLCYKCMGDDNQCKCEEITNEK